MTFQAYDGEHICVYAVSFSLRNDSTQKKTAHPCRQWTHGVLVHPFALWLYSRPVKLQRSCEYHHADAQRAQVMAAAGFSLALLSADWEEVPQGSYWQTVGRL